VLTTFVANVIGMSASSF